MFVGKHGEDFECSSVPQFLSSRMFFQGIMDKIKKNLFCSGDIVKPIVDES